MGGNVGISRLPASVAGLTSRRAGRADQRAPSEIACATRMLAAMLKMIPTTSSENEFRPGAMTRKARKLAKPKTNALRREMIPTYQRVHDVPHAWTLSFLAKVHKFAAGPQRLGVALIYLLRVLNRETRAVHPTVEAFDD
jgi:hypothetical protein